MSGHENKVMCFMEVEWDERPKKERQFGYLNMRGRRRRRRCSEFRVRSNAISVDRHIHRQRQKQKQREKMVGEGVLSSDSKVGFVGSPRGPFVISYFRKQLARVFQFHKPHWMCLYIFF